MPYIKDLLGSLKAREILKVVSLTLGSLAIKELTKLVKDIEDGLTNEPTESEVDARVEELKAERNDK